MVNLKFKHVALVAYLLLIVPIVIFMFGWLHWYFALLFTGGLVAGFVWLYKTDYVQNKELISVPIIHFVAIAAVVGIYVLMSGNCGFSVGRYDIPYRNAILFDLINYDWPVAYESGYNLAYYVAFWMIPALVGKVFGIGAAFATLWFYETAICFTAILLVANIANVQRASGFWIVATVFMLFSGLNLVGQAVVQMVGANLYDFSFSYNEGYCDGFFNGESTNFYYRCNIDCIEETYNQIVVWLVGPLFFKNRRLHSYIFLDLLLLPFSPWAALGFIPLMLAAGVVELAKNVRTNGKKSAAIQAVRGVFSPANVLGLIVCLVVFGSFFMATAHLSGASTQSESTGASFGLLTFSKMGIRHWCAWVLFCVCEFGVFAALIYKKFKKDALFWVNIAWLAVIPFIWVGTIGGRDFCMNGSLPGLNLLMIFITIYLVENVAGKVLGIRNLAIVVVLSIAFASPVMQFCLQVETMVENRTLYIVQGSRDIDTLEDKEVDTISNFICTEPENSFFFSVLAR